MKKILLFIMIALASASAQADMALKFIGTADGGDLSLLAQDLMEDTGAQAFVGSGQVWVIPASLI